MTADIHVVRRALLIGVIECLGMVWAVGHEKPHTAAPSPAAKNDVRAEIDAHAAQWLKDSDVPSYAVAYIEDGKVAWTAVYGEQSREVCGQRNARRRIDEGDCSGTSHDAAERND